MADAHKNFASSLVVTPPTPAASGTSLTVTGGEGALFPTPPFNATVWPENSEPKTSNAEIVRVTAISTDTLTIVRQQESTSARSILEGDKIVAAITVKTLTDVEAHATSTANPHSVTKAQVGLSNVPNLDTTSAVNNDHSHANKALLDTYTQTEANLADAVSKKHSHANQAVLDTTTASFTTADETKLDGIEAGAQANDVTSVAGKTGDVTLVKADVGLANVDNTSDSTKNSATATLTNKRINPRVTSTASGSSLTPDIAATDQYAYTALAANLTINAPAGTPINGNKLLFRFKDNGTSRTLTWNAIYRAVGVTLPTATTINKILYVGCIYNVAETKWDVIASAVEA